MLVLRVDKQFEQEAFGYQESQKTNFERSERIRNYSYNNKIVVDYNTNLKFSLEQFLDTASGMEILDEIQTTFLDLRMEEKTLALFKKYLKETSPEDLDYILFKS